MHGNSEYSTFRTGPCCDRGSCRGGSATYVRSLPSVCDPVTHFSLIPVDTSTVFWSPEVKVGDCAVYQITLSAPPEIDISALPFESLAVYFNDDDDLPPLIIKHKASTEEQNSKLEPGMAQMVKVGHLEFPLPEGTTTHEVEAGLRWAPGGKIVLVGTVASKAPAVLSVRLLLLNCLA